MAGWKIIGYVPPDLKKCIVVVAPAYKQLGFYYRKARLLCFKVEGEIFD